MRPGDRACTRDSPRVPPSSPPPEAGEEGRKGEIKKLRKEGEDKGEGQKRERPATLGVTGRSLIGGGYLLSHFRSTIGAAGFNFSVRNGKRWNPRAIDRLSLFADGRGDGRPETDGVPRRSMR